MDEQDHHLASLAHVKRAIAKAEHKLANKHRKESDLLHRLDCLREELAEKCIEQAEINMEQSELYQKYLREKPRSIDPPLDIVTSLSTHVVQLRGYEADVPVKQLFFLYSSQFLVCIIIFAA